MENHTNSMRVLVRPPPPDPSPSPQNGVVVVGFIGNRHDDVAHLMNKIIDSNVFGSGNLDTPLRFEEPDIVKWFEKRKLSFYHDEEKGILYLQFSMARTFPVNAVGSQFESVLEEQELGDLQGLLFMFSVCHVILLIQEGSRFDIQMLKRFRVLQAAKHAMAPFIRSQNLPPITSRPQSSASARIPISRVSPNNPSPGKSRGILNRNGSTIKLTSGLGSYTSLLPGQCTPVILFVFLDDFTEIHPSGKIEDNSETSKNLSSSSSFSARPSLPTKGSGPVVVLARPANKSEGGLRKKLQSSLEAQIRFSIKKCRTLSGSDSSHAGSRSGTISSSAPLFSLDASKAVSLVDACCSQSGESLEFAISLVEEVLDGKATPDSLLLESHQQNENKEDILSLKEFIYRQSDILRGRGGVTSTTNSGSAAGVGMVAVAAAAAAASAASGKTVTTVPELPNFETWSSSCQLILYGILSAKLLCTNESEINLMHENKTSSDSLESAVSHLENAIGLNSRFSTIWCQKAFPVAKEVYLDELPPCYPSSQHEDHLKKALRVLSSMVKGPSVNLYMKKLEVVCTSIWTSGRQLCDAVSLTGKPCMHQRHDTKALSADEIKPHSSGFVYLHACACGRSRRLRPDPFDYETANVVHNVFDDCDKLLPSVLFPEGRIKGPIQPSSWNLVRVGGARYYDPSKGLLQSGFCATEKFLLRWTMFLEKLNESNHSLLNDSQQKLYNSSVRVDTVVDTDTKISDSVQFNAGGIQDGVGSPIRFSSDATQTSSKNMSFGKMSFNFTMRKPFSEVVAGPAAASSGFPPLFSRKQPLPDAEKVVKLDQKTGKNVYNQESRKIENIPSISIDRANDDNGISGDGYKCGNRFSHIGSDVVPLNINDGEQIKASNTMKGVTVYVGFEHECPRGHRFILTRDHLNELGTSYAVAEERTFPVSVETCDKKQDPAKLGKMGSHRRTRRQSNGITMNRGSGNAENQEKLKEEVANGNTYNKPVQSTRQRKNQNERSKNSHSVKDLDSDLGSTTIDDGDCAFSLLKRSLPIYMNCPHCKDSVTKNDTSNIKFASTISQLQRIFVVTPSFPVLLAADPVIQFEVSCLPPSIPDREQKLQFNLGCPVILPPDSFLALRLPFVYGVETEDGSLHSLKPFENEPQLTAWIVKGTSLQDVSKRTKQDLGLVT
ncbi:hypothetical protein ACJIZ3_011450 [Penstemon smallii]|uniref:Nonsense-mediated mRNA decay factor SMG8 n=1 Tax=Penstemon smallii TaxID=265156 RepID=A0ABD3UME4_9LAMI